MSKLVKFIEVFKGSELTYTEVMNLDKIVWTNGEIFMLCIVLLFVGIILGIIINA